MAGDALERLATLCGVAHGYLDAWNQWREVPRESRAAILTAMGYDVSTEAAAQASLEAFEAAQWQTVLPPVVVGIVGAEGIRAPVVGPHADPGRVEWFVRCEDGSVFSGFVDPDDLVEAGSHVIEGCRLVRRMLPLDPGIPLGYHRLTVAMPSGIQAETTLIAAPQRCYLPEPLARGGRTWGLAVQLYALRSERNWGIGDFGDLQRLLSMTADVGGGIVGLNPLHALFPDRPERCSPYAPSSRLALNVLYIDVEAVPEFADSGVADEAVASPEVRKQLDSLRDTRLVDYPRVSSCKIAALRSLYGIFRKKHLDRPGGVSPRGQSFLEFRERESAVLRFAVFEALAEHFGRGRGADYNWRSWPAGFRHPDAPAVADFVTEQRQSVEFRLWLQWLAREQLHGCAVQAHRQGMPVGLYGDLAIGAHPDGADAWALGSLLAKGASLGAPPDVLNLKGQDWGFAPFVPETMRAAAFAPFSAMLRHNMRDMGALRIDHAIGLQHVYWVPHGTRADLGGYVRQPLDELLAIIALESVRNRCIVVGEDLGTLPEGLRDRLSAAGILSYRVLPFEREHDGAFRNAEDYPHLALATPGTHDMPTFAAFWRGDDLQLRQQLDHFPSEEVRVQAFNERRASRRRLLEALARARIEVPVAVDPEADGCDPPDTLLDAVHRFLARTPSALLLAQIEDLIGEVDPVNVPGTGAEYPNWQRKISVPIERLADDVRVRRVLSLLAAERPPLR